MGDISGKLFGKWNLADLTADDVYNLLSTTTKHSGESEHLELTYFGPKNSSPNLSGPIPFERGKHLLEDVLKPCAGFITRGPGQGGVLVLGWKEKAEGWNRWVGVTGLEKERLERLISNGLDFRPRSPSFEPTIEVQPCVWDNKTLLLVEVQAQVRCICGAEGSYYVRRGSSTEPLKLEECLKNLHALAGEILIPEPRIEPHERLGLVLNLFMDNEGSRPVHRFAIMIEVAWTDRGDRNANPVAPLVQTSPGMRHLGVEGKLVQVPTRKYFAKLDFALFPGLKEDVATLSWQDTTIADLKCLFITVYGERGSGHYAYICVKDAGEEQSLGLLPGSDWIPYEWQPSTAVDWPSSTASS